MEHLKIAYYLLVLLVGTAAIAYVVLVSRAYRLPFLEPFAYFLGFNNVLALVNLTSAYACANLLGFSALYRYSVFSKVLGPISRLSHLGIVYALLAVVRGFRGRRLSRPFNIVFGVVTGLLLASFVATAVLPPENALRPWLFRGQLAVFCLGVLLMIGALAGLLLDSRNIRDTARRKAVRLFGSSYLAIYAVFVVTFPLPVKVQFPPNALALLAINLIPFIWFGKPFAGAYAATPTSAEDRQAFERFCETYGLTSREANILELILRGKSNAEMEKELFISIHTVKNHITNIHSKLGVRSRWQLISLFHSGRQKRPLAGRPASESERMPQEDLWHE